jgi:hypothetical protein
MRTALLLIHIPSACLALLAGPVAMFLPKRRGLHPLMGRAYQLFVALLCVSATGLVVLLPSLWWLGLIGGATWAAALAGWVVRRVHRPGWLVWHISLMCGSYISLVTALLVNLGPRSPVVWILPTVIGTPLISLRAYRAAVSGRPARRPGAIAAATSGSRWRSAE